MSFVGFSLLCFIPSPPPFLFYIFFENPVLINQWNGPRYQRVLALSRLMCFFNRGDTEGTNSSKVLCLMFVFCFVQVCVRTVLMFLDNL